MCERTESLVNRQEILSKITNDEDRILVSRLFDKIEFCNKRNSIEHTEFLDMRQRQLLEKILFDIKYSNYVAYGGYKTAERTILIFYPSKLEDVFAENRFDFNTIFSVINILLPNELKGMYSHRTYLSGIIKTGIRREKVGDILSNKNGANIIVLKDSIEYVLDGLKTLTRFGKSELRELKLQDLEIEEPKTIVTNAIIPSMRIDSLVSEMAKTSRAKAAEIIKEERVFINHELVVKSSKETKENDIVTIRGKGKFKVGAIINSTKKGNLVVQIEKYIS